MVASRRGLLRLQILPISVLVAAVAVAAAIVGGRDFQLAIGAGLALVGVALLVRCGGIQWRTMLGTILVVILFIPIGRYNLPGSLPFQLEPYRLVVGLAIVLWLASLLIDPRVRLRRSGLEGPMMLLLAAALLSVIANGSRVSGLGADVAKSLTFFLSFLLVFWLFMGVVRDRATIDRLLRLMVGCAAVVALCTIIESKTHYNVFNHLQSVVPGLKFTGLPWIPSRDGLLRAYASGQHPIATGSMFVMMLPLTLYLAKRSQRHRRVWAMVGVVLLVGAFSTVSKTAVVMLVTLLLVFLWLRPRETKRFLPMLVPMLLVVHLIIPGTLGSIKSSFFPKNGFIAEQSKNAGNERSSARLADVGPALESWSRKPLFGEGYGTMIVTIGKQNAPILDDQWLGTLLEVGALGALAWLWLFARVIRRLGAAAREDHSTAGFLLVGLCASITAFAVSMFTYDAFAFIQVTFLMFILIAFSAAALRMRTETLAARAARRRTPPVPGLGATPATSPGHPAGIA